MTPQLLPCPACERVTALWVEVRPTERLRCPHCGHKFIYAQLSPAPTAAWQVVGEMGDDSDAEASEAEWQAGRQTIDATAPLPGSRTLHLIDPSAQTLLDLLGESETLTAETPSPPTPPMPPTDADVDDEVEAVADDVDYHQQQLVTPPPAVAADLARDSATEATPASDVSHSGPAASDWEPAAIATSDSAGTGNKFDWANAPLLTPALYERQRRRKRPSPLWSIVQIVLGGLAAIPIGLLLVWHVIGVDVGDAAPRVAKFASWIVPEDLRPHQQPANDDLDPQPIRSGLPAAGGERTYSSDSPSAVQDAAGGARPAMEATVAPVDTVASVETAAPVDAVARPMEVADRPADVTDQVAAAPPPAELNAPLLENTFALIRQATEHLQQWSVAAHEQKVDLRTLAQATYGELTDLALTLEKLPPENPVWRTVRRQLKPLGMQVVEDSQVRRLITEGARFWVATQELNAAENGTSSNGKSYGLAMIVTVETAEQMVAGNKEWWRVVASSTSRVGKPPLELRIPRDVAVELADGRPAPQQELFLLGGVQPATATVGADEDSAPESPRFVASYAMGLK